VNPYKETPISTKQGIEPNAVCVRTIVKSEAPTTPKTMSTSISKHKGEREAGLQPAIRFCPIELSEEEKKKKKESKIEISVKIVQGSKGTDDNLCKVPFPLFKSLTHQGEAFTMMRKTLNDDIFTRLDLLNRKSIEKRFSYIERCLRLDAQTVRLKCQSDARMIMLTSIADKSPREYSRATLSNKAFLRWIEDKDNLIHLGYYPEDDSKSKKRKKKKSSDNDNDDNSSSSSSYSSSSSSDEEDEKEAGRVKETDKPDKEDEGLEAAVTYTTIDFERIVFMNLAEHLWKDHREVYKEQVDYLGHKIVKPFDMTIVTF
jgi:hypothetical protein